MGLIICLTLISLFLFILFGIGIILLILNRHSFYDLEIEKNSSKGLHVGVGNFFFGRKTEVKATMQGDPKEIVKGVLKKDRNSIIRFLVFFPIFPATTLLFIIVGILILNTGKTTEGYFFIIFSILFFGLFSWNLAKSFSR